MSLIADQEILLLDILKIIAPDSSATTLRSWIEKGRVVVSGQVASKAKMMVHKGQEVIIGHRVNFIHGGIKILFEDDHLVVIEKPEGLLSVATDFKKTHNVHSFLKKRLHAGRVFPVHRLDRDTSGVMIFALSESSRSYFKEQFKDHTIEKIYYALVEGKVKEKTGTWESYLREDDNYFVKSTSNVFDGKLATTHYEVIQQNANMTLLRLHLETGRKNQLRVHCSENGFPIVGDKKYGSKTNPLKRVCLHSQKLSFVHPETQKSLSFESPLPKAFQLHPISSHAWGEKSNPLWST